MEEIIKNLNIRYKGNYNEDKDSYIVDLPDSDAFGNVYTILENSDLVELLEDSQLVTEEGSSLIYQVIDEPYILNLLANWESNQYQLIINEI